MGLFSRKSKSSSNSGSTPPPPAPPPPPPILDPFLGNAELEAVATAYKGGDWQRVDSFLAVDQQAWAQLAVMRQGTVNVSSAWIEHAPSCRSLTFHGFCQMDEAGKARGTGFASTVTEEGRKGFKHWATEAEQTLLQATELDPADPWPWCVLISTGMALGKSVAVRRERFDEAHQRSPFHYDAVRRMTQAIAPKWGGKQQDYLAFGDWVGERAPADSPARAAFAEVYFEVGAGHGRSIKDTPASSGAYLTDVRNHMREHGGQKLWAILDDYIGTLGPDGIAPPHLVQAFNWMLFATEPTTAEEAVATLKCIKAIDDRPTEFPWLNINNKPAKRYAKDRDKKIGQARTLMS